jgi:hypothetical protein
MKVSRQDSKARRRGKLRRFENEDIRFTVLMTQSY